ncbi:MAG: hypothetical protein Q8P67_18360, partial [archaeon]|nr:hypothetical protein [archaeon]
DQRCCIPNPHNHLSIGKKKQKKRQATAKVLDAFTPSSLINDTPMPSLPQKKALGLERPTSKGQNL